jgi:hypothetical protein
MKGTEMNTETVKHLASKYRVAQRTIRDLHSLSLTWQTSLSELMRDSSRRQYDAIVAKRCRGIDPLV